GGGVGGGGGGGGGGRGREWLARGCPVPEPPGPARDRVAARADLRRSRMNSFRRAGEGTCSPRSADRIRAGRTRPLLRAARRDRSMFRVGTRRAQRHLPR